MMEKEGPIQAMYSYRGSSTFGYSEVKKLSSKPVTGTRLALIVIRKEVMKAEILNGTDFSRIIDWFKEAVARVT